MKTVEDIQQLIAEAIYEYTGGDFKRSQTIVRDMRITDIFPGEKVTHIVAERPGVVIGVRGGTLQALENKIGRIYLLERTDRTHTDAIEAFLINEDFLTYEGKL